MSGRLSGKTALVAGGTAGIGLAVASAYASVGACVWIGGRRSEGASIASDAGCSFVALDVADEASWADALAEIPEKLDVLVLNAGVAQPSGPLASLSPEAARQVVDVNLLGVLWGLMQGPERMNDGGSIVITSSISAVLGTPWEGLYGATKAGASALARSAAIDLGPRGIRVNAVQPGPTWTKMNPMPERLLEVMAPSARKGRVEDLVGLYVFLASDESSYLTGQALSVDGGLTAGFSQALLGAVASQLHAEATAA
jgi:NAD(P)-dependent dehydrogenase (short-subunit alcohol dehydrogenase family)